VKELLNLVDPLHLLQKQQVDGSWLYKGNRSGDEFGKNYELLETWSQI